MKKKSQTFRKFLALVLSVAMIITYMPTSVIALAYVDNVPKVTQEETSQESNQTTEARTTEEPAQEVEKPKEEPASDAETPAETGVTEPEEGQTGDQPAGVEGGNETGDQAEQGTPADDTGKLTDDTGEAEKTEADKALPDWDFRGQAGDLSVEAKAEGDAFPEGTDMRVTEASDETVQAIRDSTGAEDVKAVDIAFFKDDSKVDPEKDVFVSMSASGLQDSLKYKIVRYDGGINAVDAPISGATAKFDTRDFSVYAFVGTAPKKVKAAPATRAAEETWTVTFYNRDAQVHATVEVTKGEAIGDKIPVAITREDYNAYWAVGTLKESSQGPVTEVTGGRIDGSFVPEADTIIVPDYDKISHNITFYTDDTKTDVVKTETVDYETNYCLNDIPAVPPKSGHAGKWVYSGGDFSNAVSAKDNDIEVWAEYDQNIFNVSFIVGSDTYKTDTYYYGDKLTLPKDPVVEGKEFIGWFDGETEYTGNETVTSDLTITAKFEDEFIVTFIVRKDDGTESESLSQYFRTAGEPIGTMPQDPFIAGKIFEKWVTTVDGKEVEVTADTIINADMTVVAKFREVAVYNITAEYYYLNDNGQDVIFNTDLIQAEANELPYTITAPASTQTDSDEVEGGPVYYASTPTATVTLNDFDDNKSATVRIQYVEHTAEYDYVYKLKDLNGNGYTEIPNSREHVYGVLNSEVTPTVKSFDYATLENAETVTITQAEGQEVTVYYNRKNFSLSYDTNGGSYVAGGTYRYGETVRLPSSNPTRTGYSFAGWYSDPALTDASRVTGSVTINGDTTLYAKWTGQSVNYTIIYMKEVYDNATGTTSYEYENSRDATGTVGMTVYAANAPNISSSLNGYERDAAMNGTSTSAGEGEDTAVVIAADGSTTLKVYYSLIRYTLVFNLNNSNGRITMKGQTYTGSNYRVENVVLGQDISSMWPSNSNEVYSVATSGNRYFRYWTGAGNYVTKRYELIWEDVSNANSSHVMTFTANWTNSNNDRNAQYWLQQPDGTWAVAEEYTQTGLNTTNLGAKTIDGYTKHNGDASRPNGSYPNSGNTDVQVWVDGYPVSYTDGGGHTSATPGANERTIERTIDGVSVTLTFDHAESYTSWSRTRYRYIYTGNVPGHYITEQKYVYNFYYDRAQYDIEYYYNGRSINTIEDVYFEADISGSRYNYTPTRPSGVDSDYTWGGWYADSALQTPYTFDTMPGHDLPLYAKWIAPTYTVSFELDGGTPAIASQTVEKYKKAVSPETTPAKNGYTFDGWYTTADGNTLFDWNTQITADTTVYAHWTRSTLEYTVHYVDENGNAVASDKTVVNPNFEAGKKVTEQALAVAGYRPNKSSETIELSSNNSENVITFVYSEKVATTGYTVRYVIADGETGAGTEVAQAKTVENVPGDTSSVIEMAAAVDYDALYAAKPELKGLEFFPDEVEKTCVLTADANQNVYTFYYSSFKNAKVTVNYVDMDGNPVSDMHSETLKVGKTFTLSRTPIAGWELSKAVEGTSYGGTEAHDSYKVTEKVAESGLVFTLFYQKKATVTVVNQSKQYDGTALKLPADLANQVTVEGLLEGDSLTSLGYNYANADNGSDNDGRLNAGVATVTPKDAVISGHSNPDYYTVRYISGTLEVTKINVTVRIEPDRWTNAPYTGEEYKTGFTNPDKDIDDYILISHSGYSAKHLNDIWESVKAKAKYDENTAGVHYYGIAEKDAGDYTYSVGLTEAGLPQDDNYSVSLYVRPGRLHILPKEAVITTGSAEKAYDGTPLTKDEATISGLVSADEGKVTVTATGTITDPGDTENTYTIDWGSVKSSNYEIKENLGTLKVTRTELKITVKDAIKEYDGTPQTGYILPPDGITGTGETISTNEYTVTGLAEGDILSVSYTPAERMIAGPADGAFI